MSWTIKEQYCCLQLPGISAQEALRDLSNELAHEIWSNWKENGSAPDHFDSIDQELSESAEISIPLITNEILEYLCDVYQEEKHISLVVRCNSEFNHDDTDLFRQICQFLFKKSQATHYLIRSAAFDKLGGYSHQWIGYWKDGEIVIEDTDNFFEQLFQKNTVRPLSEA